MRILLLKTTNLTANDVIANAIYMSSGQPRQKYDQIWIIEDVRNGKVKLRGRYQSAHIVSLNNAANGMGNQNAGNFGSIPAGIFSQSPNLSHWNYLWKLCGFLDKSRSVVVSNLLAYNNVWINLTNIPNLANARYVQNIGYVDLDKSDSIILATNYGIIL